MNGLCVSVFLVAGGCLVGFMFFCCSSGLLNVPLSISHQYTKHHTYRHTKKKKTLPNAHQNSCPANLVDPGLDPGAEAPCCFLAVTGLLPPRGVEGEGEPAATEAEEEGLVVLVAVFSMDGRWM